MDPQEIDDIELGLLLEGVRRRFGVDLSGYARASLRRRIHASMAMHGVPDMLALLGQLLRDGERFGAFLDELSVSVTDFFRDPTMFKSFRQQIVPLLRTYPRLRVWHAGCATGEEVYSMAILLEEEGLLERTTLYATDVSGVALAKARDGFFDVRRLSDASERYQQAGGNASLLDYFTTRGDTAKVAQRLGEKIFFSTHNLATDAKFVEAEVVLCRNVLIYFGRALQDRVLRLLTETLCPLGVLCLGSRESLLGSSVEKEFTAIDAQHRLFRRRR